MSLVTGPGMSALKVHRAVEPCWSVVRCPLSVEELTSDL